MPEPDDAIGTEPGTPPPDVTIDAPPEADTTSPSSTPAGGLSSTQAAEVRAHHLEANQSAIGRLVAHDVRSRQGAIGLVRARSVEVTEGAVGAIAAERVEMRAGFAFLMVARHVSGDVKVLLDWRSAAAAMGALLVVGRLLRGRR